MLAGVGLRGVHRLPRAAVEVLGERLEDVMGPWYPTAHTLPALDAPIAWNAEMLTAAGTVTRFHLVPLNWSPSGASPLPFPTNPAAYTLLADSAKTENGSFSDASAPPVPGCDAGVHQDSSPNLQPRRTEHRRLPLREPWSLLATGVRPIVAMHVAARQTGVATCVTRRRR
jgi:hypothetical protein